MAAGLKTYKLPPRFYHDHRERELPEEGISSLVSENVRTVYVEMDADAYADLLSDARHYSAAWQFGPEYRGLCSSAKATVKALVEQGEPVDRHACPHCGLPNVTGRGSIVCPSCEGPVS